MIRNAGIGGQESKPVIAIGAELFPQTPVREETPAPLIVFAPVCDIGCNRLNRLIDLHCCFGCDERLVKTKLNFRTQWVVKLRVFPVELGAQFVGGGEWKPVRGACSPVGRLRVGVAKSADLLFIHKSGLAKKSSGMFFV